MPTLLSSRVVVVIPAYNEAKYIEQALLSLSRQTYQDFIVYISDNASTDETELRCLNYCIKDQRFHYFRQKKNIGAIANLEFCLSATESEFVIFLGAHDALYPEFIELSLRAMEQNPCASLVFGHTHLVDESNKTLQYTNGGNYIFNEPLSPAQRYLALLDVLYSCEVINQLIRRSFLDYPRLGSVPSGDLVMLCHLVGHGPFIRIEQPLYIRRDFAERENTSIERITGKKGIQSDYSALAHFFFEDIRTHSNIADHDRSKLIKCAIEWVNRCYQLNPPYIAPLWGIAREQRERPCCVFLNTYYPQFIERFYTADSALASASYAVQLAALQASNFGDADFYSFYLQQAGWQAHDLIANAGPLQAAWAAEHGLRQVGLELVVEQLRFLKPDVVYLQDLSLATPEFIQQIRPFVRLIAGQIASPLPNVDLPSFDLIISSFPHFVEEFRRLKLTAYYQSLAFDSRVLASIGNIARDIEVSFVGGISPAHGKGLLFLESLAVLTPVEFWGYGAGSLALTSPICARHHGEVWGLDMFKTLARSKITINRHIDVAGHYANNMRLFEATACGALLITDYKDNLAELFEIGSEVVVYRSAEECAALIDYYIDHPLEAKKIAEAGQARTLRDHSYKNNMQQLSKILHRHLRYQTESSHLPVLELDKISYGKVDISKNQVKKSHLTAWKSAAIPARQRSLVQYELQKMYHGDVPLPFDVLAKALKGILQVGATVLEIGCASGYYSEVIPYLLKKSINYTGVDYSDALIKMALDYYPDADVKVADGAKLPFTANQFEVVISSCILLHVSNAAEHIKETVRVAKQYIVVHRTPVSRLKATQYYKKFAYGEETVELRYNETELLNMFYAKGCRFVRFIEFAADVDKDEFEVSYILQKVKGADYAK